MSIVENRKFPKATWLHLGYVRCLPETFLGGAHDLWKSNNRSNNTILRDDGMWIHEAWTDLFHFPTRKVYSRMAPKAEKPETKGLRQQHRGLVLTWCFLCPKVTHLERSPRETLAKCTTTTIKVTVLGM